MLKIYPPCAIYIIYSIGGMSSTNYDICLLNKNKYKKITAERFFNWDEVSYDKLLTELRNNPWEHESILKYVIDKVKHFTEFKVKKEHLKHKYDKKLNELYAEYMREEEI